MSDVMKVVFDEAGEFHFIGELDFGRFGTFRNDDIDLGYASDDFHPNYDFHNDEKIKSFLPEGDFETRTDYSCTLILNLIKHAHQDIYPHLDTIYNELWYHICAGWISTAYPFWGSSPTESVEDYIFPDKMPVGKVITQAQFSENFYKPKGEWLRLPVPSEDQPAGKIFTGEVRQTLFPMVDFDYIDKSINFAGATLLDSKFASISLSSPVNDGMLLCGVMAELQDDYQIWSFHNH